MEKGNETEQPICQTSLDCLMDEQFTKYLYKLYLSNNLHYLATVVSHLPSSMLSGPRM